MAPDMVDVGAQTAQLRALASQDCANEPIAVERVLGRLCFLALSATLVLSVVDDNSHLCVLQHIDHLLFVESALSHQLLVSWEQSS